MSRLDDLRARYRAAPTDEQLRFARAVIAIKAGVEALGERWRCHVDVFNNEPKTANVNVYLSGRDGASDRAGSWALARGTGMDALYKLLVTIRRSADEGDLTAGYRALFAAYAKNTLEHMAAVLAPPDPHPLPLPG